MHYIVSPLPFGSYENADLLRRAIDDGFSATCRDNQGLAPYDYALKQESGVLKRVFEEKLKPEDLKVRDEIMDVDDVVMEPPVQKVNFEADARAYLEDIQI